MCEIVHRATERFARLEDVRARERPFALAALREQIPAEEGSRRRFHEQTTFPGMRHMRCVEPTERASAGGEFLAVPQRARRSRREVVQRGQGGYLAA